MSCGWKMVELDRGQQLTNPLLGVVDAVQLGEELEVLLGGQVGIEQRHFVRGGILGEAAAGI